MKCWTCGTILSNLERKISFRAECTQCGAALHCCLNCKNYAPGKPNDCSIPGTEYVRDRSANNFCEEFVFLGKGPSSKPENAPRKFDDLFQ